jgi:hypothetical protein
MTPFERAESLRLAIEMHIEPMPNETTGHHWTLSPEGLAKLAAAIMAAENDAIERSARLCDDAQNEGRVTRSQLISPDYFETKARVAQELATAIRALKSNTQAVGQLE